MSAYEYHARAVQPGPLRLRSGVALPRGGVSLFARAGAALPPAPLHASRARPRGADDDEGAPAGDAADPPGAPPRKERRVDAGAAAPPDSRTAAQRAYDEATAARELERARAIAAKPHAAHVADFNKALEKQPEHNDLFKTALAGSG